MTTRRNFTVALAAMPWITNVEAQATRRQRTVVVPYPPGGSSDVLGRVYANALASQTGETVIVENRPGAGGTIGAAYVAGMPGDGRTVLYTLGNLLLNQEFLLKDVTFRPLQSLFPLAKTCDLKVAIVTAANHPANDLTEFIAMAKQAPAKHSFAYYGDLGVVSMASEAGIDLIRVPYKGGPNALPDVVGGRVDIIASSLTQALPMLQAGKLKILAVMTEERWADHPNVRTVKEVLPRYKAIDYQGIFLPAETPRAVVDSAWSTTSAVLSNPEYRRAVMEKGAIPAPMPPEEFKRFFLADYANIKKIVETAGIQRE